MGVKLGQHIDIKNVGIIHLSSVVLDPFYIFCCS